MEVLLNLASVSVKSLVKMVHKDHLQHIKACDRFTIGLL